jgi:hypothetical protein
MAKLKLLQPHEGHEPGDVIEIPGGIASVLAVRRIGVLLAAEPKPEPEPEGEKETPEDTNDGGLLMEDVDRWCQEHGFVLVVAETWNQTVETIDRLALENSQLSTQARLQCELLEEKDRLAATLVESVVAAQIEPRELAPGETLQEGTIPEGACVSVEVEPEPAKPAKARKGR